MSSAISGPKAPSYSPTRTIIREVPAYQEMPPAEDGVDTSGNTSKKRSENLLRRQRGRFGTILTGFKGILAEKSDTPSTRRKLLGE